VSLFPIKRVYGWAYVRLINPCNYELQPNTLYIYLRCRDP